MRYAARSDEKEGIVMNDHVEKAPPASETEPRANWVQPQVSRLDTASAQAGPGDLIADATEFS
ncbi:MAG TPA: hypothetical protein VIT45_07875 [Allosphingosinicella sp.]